MRNSILILLFVFIYTSSISFAQQIQGSKGKATKQATVKISNLEQVKADGEKFKAPNPGWQIPDWTYAKSKIIYKQPESEAQSQQPVFRETSPLPDTSFAGLMDNGTAIPPDVNGAAGPDHLMQALNTEVRITDKQGAELFTTSHSNFWDPMPNNGASFDPKIVYDPYGERWIMMAPSGSNSTETRLYIGVSTSTNPLDEWNMYWIDPDTTNVLWFDYPNLGFNKNWISIGGIMRNSAFEAVEFVVFALDKQAIYEGEDEPGYSRFTTTLGSAIVPSFTYDPDQEELYLISTGDGNDEGYGYVNLFKLSGEVENPSFELKGSIGIPEPWENWSYENHADFLPQLGSSEKLNSVDARMHTMINRNNELWAVHHIYLPADDPERTSVQWWHLDTNGVILERGRIDDPTNEFSFAYPSIAVNANEDVFIGHGVYSLNQYAGAAYSYKAYFDDPNSMRTYYQYKEGLASYYKTFGGGRNRWGDYSAVCVDPVADVNFWALHEYAELPSGNDQWGTWWAFLKPSFPPVADFNSDETLIPTGEDISFNDLTLGVPISWNWFFEGGNPATANVQNPESIVYEQEGTFDVMLIVSNDLGTDTIIKEDYITVSSSILPEVEFEADKLVACTGEIVSFTDLSLYSPIQWEWQFDPPSVTFINETDQTSQHPDVEFNEATNYGVTLTVWNLNGSAELTKFDMIVSGGYPLFVETFEPETFKAEEWKIENPDDDITWEYFEVGGSFPGNTAAGIDFFHYYAISQRDRLITPTINLSDYDNAILDFEYAYAKRIPELTDSLVIFISDDCGETWDRIFAGGEDGTGNFATHEQTDEFWPTEPEDWCGEGWGANCVSLNLKQWTGQPNVKLAFESWSGYGNPLFIDNLMISVYVGEEEDAVNEEIILYPNPSKDEFNLVLPSTHHFTEIRLINSFGQLLYTRDINRKIDNYKIPIDQNWTNGVYFIHLSGHNTIVIKKVIIK